MDLWITLLGCLKQILNVEECLTRILCLLDDGIDVLATIIPWLDLLNLDLYLEPKVSQMTRQVGIERSEGQHVEHTLHLWVPDPVDSEGDGAHGGADKIVSRVVEGHCC